jgi:signal transduction histidine kinase
MSGGKRIVETINYAGMLGANPDGAQESRLVEAATPTGWKLSFIDRLSESDRQVLQAKGQRRWCGKSTVICQEGDPGDSLYIVETGKVAVLKEMSDGRSIVLGYRGAGEVLGEMSLVGQQPRSASIVAVEDTYLLTISAADFPALMDDHPGIRWAILNVLNDRLHAADTARTAIIQAEQTLQRRVRRLATEAEHQADLARVRQETLELIAHDLRTPLTVIDGCLQMLRATMPDTALGSTGDVLELAIFSTKRLSSLLATLLETARQEELGLSLTVQRVNLAELIESVMLSVQPTAANCQISLAWQIPPDLPELLGDGDKVERVVTNLLENALSYTPDGGSITVEVEAKTGEIDVSVTDTGPGIPAEYRETIFERFAQVPGIAGRRKGFGLGLYFCRQVVQAHGGRIWMEPGPDQIGSRFVFTLPLEVQKDRD